MSIEEQRKQKFLRFVVEAKDNGGPFENPELNKGWQIWNAALDSVVIELPEMHDLRYHGEFVRGMRVSARRIEEAGLKVAP